MKKLILLLSLSVLLGCSKDLTQPIEKDLATKSNEISSSTFQESQFGSPMILGEKIKNPYSTNSLKKSRSVVVPTHYYVRFLPENNHEYSLLMKSVQFFPFPLDREVIEGGSFYRDPDPANIGKRFSWQYAVVSIKDELPNVHHEILDELCIPDNESLGTSSVATRGIIPVDPPQKHTVVVRVWDSKLRMYIPLPGLPINVINTYIGASLTYGVTDNTGTATMKDAFYINSNIFYSIAWRDSRNWRWFITDIDNNQLFYNVKVVEGVTNIDIRSNSQNVVVEQLLGTIHRAAYRTYYKRNSDLVRPTHDDAIQINYIDGSHPIAAGFYHSKSGNIEIFGRISGEYLTPTLSVFSTTAHELGHLNHDVNSGRRYQVFTEAENIIAESWAKAVEKLLTDLEYGVYGYSFYHTESLPYVMGPPGPSGEVSMKDFVIPNYYNRQEWPFGKDYTNGKIEYSPIFIDLMDNENQRTYYILLLYL